MLRSATVRPLARGIATLPVKGASLSASVHTCRGKASSNASALLSKNVPTLSKISLRPTASLRLQYATKSKTDAAHEKLRAHPDSVSLDSTTRAVFEGRQSSKENEADMLGGIKADLETVKDTFKLSDVPRESYYIGAAGVLPYLATSISTVYLAYDINQAHHNNGIGFIFSPETAHQILTVIEPIQIGYGAVIISFLGAIHWGLEYAGYGGYHSYRRYIYGVLAPAVAWPTMLMPVEYALITQFLAFTMFYFADARATTRGWCPSWYSTYRFVLTFIVGASIVMTLIGRGQVIEGIGSLPALNDQMEALRDSQWRHMEQEERERKKRLAAEEESKDDAEEDTSDEKDDNSKDDSADDSGDDK